MEGRKLVNLETFPSSNNAFTQSALPFIKHSYKLIKKNSAENGARCGQHFEWIPKRGSFQLSFQLPEEQEVAGREIRAVGRMRKSCDSEAIKIPRRPMRSGIVTVEKSGPGVFPRTIPRRSSSKLAKTVR
jgi:hypothetical protein